MNSIADMSSRRWLAVGAAALVAVATLVVGLQRLWAHAEGHDVPGGSSLDLKYPRLLSKVTRETLGIRTAPVMRRPIEEVVRVTGQLKPRPDGRATLAAPISGTIRAIRANVGTSVTAAAEEVLVVLDSVEAAKLQNDLLAEGRRLRHAAQHLAEAEKMSRRTALQEVLNLLVQHRTATDGVAVAEERLSLLQKGGSSVMRRDLVTAEGEKTLAMAAARSVTDRLRAMGVSAELLSAWSRAADPDISHWLTDSKINWERIEIFGRPFDLLEKEHEVAVHATEVDRLIGELRILGLPEPTIAALAAGTGKPQAVQLRAPLAGRVTARHVNVGSFVQAGQPLLEITDNATVLVEAEVPEALLAAVLDRTTQKVRLRTPILPGRVLTGEVLRIDPDIHPTTRTAHAVVALDNPDGRLPMGSFVEATLIVREAKQALTVPADAIVRQGPISFVWIESSFGEESEYEKRDVVVGAVDDQYAEIVRGDLSPVHKVVTRGAYQLTLIPAVSSPLTK